VWRLESGTRWAQISLTTVYLPGEYECVVSCSSLCQQLTAARMPRLVRDDPSSSRRSWPLQTSTSRAGSRNSGQSRRRENWGFESNQYTQDRLDQHQRTIISLDTAVVREAASGLSGLFPFGQPALVTALITQPARESVRGSMS
jgi:hypothetical protein